MGAKTLTLAKVHPFWDWPPPINKPVGGLLKIFFNPVFYGPLGKSQNYGPLYFFKFTERFFGRKPNPKGVLLMVR